MTIQFDSSRIKKAIEPLKNAKLTKLTATLEGAKTELPVPPDLFNVLHQIIRELEKGKTLVVSPKKQYMTTSEAAEVLDISRQHLCDLLDNGKIAIPCERLGNGHRRLRVEDVMEFREALDRKRATTLEQLAEEAQELDLGY
ncbi:MAG: helix-turn-helix domain-containing protein [Symploca sp. SIO2E6]|nr:helix-turn-helix domain-containing protein [Symploca sp. SIO2E6]